jgi:prolyl 4-hydroxylase
VVIEDEISTVWHEWIVQNLQRGCTQKSMAELMVQSKFDLEIAAAHIARVASIEAEKLRPIIANSAPYNYEGSRIKNGNTIRLADCEVKVVVRLNQPDIVLFDGFMTDAECDQLVELAKNKLLPSTIVDPETGSLLKITERSSNGTYFQRSENEFVERLERRIAELMNWPVERGEGIQVLHYQTAAEYRPHFDYFPPQDPGSAAHMVQGGQRVATLVMYLNDVTEGGGTSFPNVGLTVLPRRGSAAYFAYGNSLGQVDPATLHAGEPVMAGEKWIATKWVRQRQYGG